jgi:Spy/CpxP family protein refolding chaperone
VTIPPDAGAAAAPPPSRSGVNARVVAALVVVLALITGILVGVAADRRMLMHWEWRHGGGIPPFGAGMRGPHGRGGPPDVVRQRFASELGLTPQQVAQVDSIMSRRMAERRALEDSIAPRMRLLLDSTRADIERVLTPEQRQKFEAWRARHGDGRRPGP